MSCTNSLSPTRKGAGICIPRGSLRGERNSLRKRFSGGKGKVGGGRRRAGILELLCTGKGCFGPGAVGKVPTPTQHYLRGDVGAWGCWGLNHKRCGFDGFIELALGLIEGQPVSWTPPENSHIGGYHDLIKITGLYLFSKHRICPCILI